MLLYSNKGLVRQICELKGSVIFTGVGVFGGSFLGVVCAGLQILTDAHHPLAPRLPNNYGLVVLGTVVAFGIVFRTNLAFGRFWEALTQAHFMYSKWEDAFVQFSVFAKVTIDDLSEKGDVDSMAKVRRVEKIADNMERHFSLLSACAADRLANGDISLIEDRASRIPWKSQIVLAGELDRGLHAFPELTVNQSDEEIVRSLSPKLRNGQYLVRAVPTFEEKELLKNAGERVTIIMSWILSNLATVSKDLDIAAPIQSRMYQELSNGILAYCNCVKISDIPFPFPFAQLQSVLVLAFAAFIPVYMCVFTQSYYVGPILSFLLFQSLWCINQVSLQLENPFGTDLNDVSLNYLHTRFMEALGEVRHAQEIHKQDMKQFHKSESVKIAGMSMSGESFFASLDEQDEASTTQAGTSECDQPSTPDGESTAAVAMRLASRERSRLASALSSASRLSGLSSRDRSSVSSSASELRPDSRPDSDGPTWLQIPATLQKNVMPSLTWSGDNSPALNTRQVSQATGDGDSTGEGICRVQNVVGEVLDRQLAIINGRMERHLARISKDLQEVCRISQRWENAPSSAVEI